MKETENRSSRTGLITIAVIAGLAATLACVCGLGVLFLLGRIDSLPPLIAMWLPTATSTPASAAAMPTPLPVLATPTPPPTASPTTTPTRRPSATPTPTHTPTLPSTPSPTITASPTPFVCRDIADLSVMTLAPGQRFECTIGEETLTALANEYKESPCSQTRFRLDNGELELECRMGLTMSATITAQAQNCRIAVNVLRGTFGFTGVVQELIKTQFNTIRYDTVCVEQVDMDDGQVYIAGKGR